MRRILYASNPNIPNQDSARLDIAANSPVPRKAEQRDCKIASTRMVSAMVPAYLARDSGEAACADTPGTAMIGFGEPGGLVVERDRGLRVRAADLEAGAVGGGMPLASALLDRLCDFVLLEPAMVAREEEEAPPMRGWMSGACSGLTTVVASSRRSPNIRKRVRGILR